MKNLFYTVLLVSLLLITHAVFATVFTVSTPVPAVINYTVSINLDRDAIPEDTYCNSFCKDNGFLAGVSSIDSPNDPALTPVGECVCCGYPNDQDIPPIQFQASNSTTFVLRVSQQSQGSTANSTVSVPVATPTPQDENWDVWNDGVLGEDGGYNFIDHFLPSGQTIPTYPPGE